MVFKFKGKAIDEIEGRHSYYIDTLVNLSKFPLWKPVKIKDLEINRGVIQKAYKEIKNEDFKGTLVDYLCWVSMSYCIITKIVLAGLISLGKGEKIKNLLDKQLHYSFELFQMDTLNSLRLFLKDKNCIKKVLNKFMEIEEKEKEKIVLILTKGYEKEINIYLKYK